MQSPSSEQTLTTPPSAEAELSVVHDGSGRLAVSVDVDGEFRTERIELPAAVRNVGNSSVTILGMKVLGTGLEAEVPRQVLAPGGERPLTLVRVVDCSTSPSLPAQLDLRVDILNAGAEVSLLLPLPQSVVAQYRDAHACSPERRAADDAEGRARAEARARAEEQAAEAAREAREAAQTGAGG